MFGTISLLFCAIVLIFGCYRCVVRCKFILGFVNGCEDHSSHESCDTFYLGGKLITLCGLDFYENGLPSNITNVYSTILFSQRAEQIIKQHDHNEVSLSFTEC